MGRVSKRNKQRKDAWNMSMEAQRIKKSMLSLTLQMLQYTSSHHPPPPPSPLPHLTQNKDKEMEKKRPYYS
ncbi:hypothetical protein E2C01_053855 [Portunus trituberculatus]|uniref:Uncharacterized protein n=1 Tax=Portunus trituberculatus TaxID=210409 RepID=A0A5B7GRL3_PORTR|nr:hypothetical protein [Portunus trituberculatus]